MVLTLAMAVDGNVIIYERMREEVRAGKGMRMWSKTVSGMHIHPLLTVTLLPFLPVLSYSSLVQVRYKGLLLHW